MHLMYRQTCRICGSANLKKVIDLGEQHLQGSFVKENKEDPPLRKIPTELVRCDPTAKEGGCGLLQMAISVPPIILYSSYWYRSGTNQTMRDHLKGITAEAIEIVGKKRARVLDIGCNDGTLLKSYPKGFVRFGVDPSDSAQEIGAEFKVIKDIFPSAELNSVIGDEHMDIITSIAMFYDLEDPVDFTKNVKSILSEDGLWIIEMAYMPSMLEKNSYDTICHEHLEYYSFTVIENLMRRCGMQVVRVAFNDINGGSIRCYVTHSSNFRFKNNRFQKEIEEVRRKEFDLELDTDKPYHQFQERINRHREELRSLLEDLKKKGKTIHIYGASTKGNTILQWCGLDGNIIDYAADRNKDKHGARTIGTNVPIISEEESRAMKPDYYLVLPWHFRREFLDREKEALDKGVGFIFPLPKIEIFKK